MSTNGKAARPGGDGANGQWFSELTTNENKAASAKSQARFRCADCLHFRPFALRSAPHVGECRRTPGEVAFYLDGEAVITVRYVADDDCCDAFHSRRSYAARCRGRAA